MTTPSEELHALNERVYVEAGKFLRDQRKLLGWSRKQVAEKINDIECDKYYIQVIEDGEGDYDDIRDYAEALGFECIPCFTKFLDPTSGERVRSTLPLSHPNATYFVDVDIVETRKVDSRTIPE